MEKKFRDILLNATDEMGLTLTETQLALFETYRETLLLWNSKMNLVSLQSDLEKGKLRLRPGEPHLVRSV